MAAVVENADLFAPRDAALPLTPLRDHAHTYSPSSDGGALALFAKTVGSNRHTVHGNQAPPAAVSDRAAPAAASRRYRTALGRDTAGAGAR